MQIIFDSIQKHANQPISDHGNANGDAARLFHGRGQCYEGLGILTVDWFSPLLLVTFFKQPAPDWLDEFREGMRQFDEAESIGSIVFQHRYQAGSPVEVIKGGVPDDLNAIERDLRFRLSIGKNQNVGFFLDMANCRQWLHGRVEGQSVLNLFSYTCAFSVVAANAGAKTVVNVDMAKGALATGRLNHKINDISTDSIFFFSHDIFKSWGKIRKYGPYDCIIVDPPSFQRGSFDAKKDYQKIVKRLPGLLSENGVVMACLNSPELDFSFLRELFETIGGFVELAVIPVPESFPEVDKDKGLKTLVFKKA